MIQLEPPVDRDKIQFAVSQPAYGGGDVEDPTKALR